VALTPVFIRAVPWVDERRRHAKALREATGGQVVWDLTHESWDTWLIALKMAAAGPAVHLEDDVVLTHDWRAKVEAAIAEHPDVVVQFFTNRKADVDVGSRWERGREYLMNQCFYVPERLARPMLDFALAYEMPPLDRWGGPSTHKCQDLMVSHFLVAVDERYWVHVPSLVDHLPWTSSVNRRRPRERRARVFEP
jgi:hypothetical protein